MFKWNENKFDVYHPGCSKSLYVFKVINIKRCSVYNTSKATSNFEYHVTKNSINFQSASGTQKCNKYVRYYFHSILSILVKLQHSSEKTRHILIEKVLIEM